MQLVTDEKGDNVSTWSEFEKKKGEKREDISGTRRFAFSPHYSIAKGPVDRKGGRGESQGTDLLFQGCRTSSRCHVTRRTKRPSRRHGKDGSSPQAENELGTLSEAVPRWPFFLLMYDFMREEFMISYSAVSYSPSCVT